MSDLIEALQIMLKYCDPKYPTCCIHDTLIVAVDPAVVAQNDKERLHVLGFAPSVEFDHCFVSYRFGSN